MALLTNAVWAGPLSPEEERATFQLADPALTIDLVAAEPDVDSPVAITWDADGRMYVAEMRDYPTGPAAGQIRRLEDCNGDGRYETSLVFAEDLAFPNSVLAVGQGLLVTAAPDLLLLVDHDGDGRADDRQVVFTGFAEGNQQLRANGLTWGLDNWIYGANGRSDGEVRRPSDSPEAAVSIRGRDFRFRLDGPFEAIVGQSQFGQSRDDWGERFLSWNTVPIRHAMLDADDVIRNPRLAAAVRNLAAADETGQVYPLSPRPLQFNRESALFYNALCGLHIYRGDALPEAYRGNAFVGESLSSLVHRRVLEADGPTFVSRRGEAGREFLAARDGWFHPVYFATGPDGALYVVDFYRRFVEHPQFVPADKRESVAWQEGAPGGRIWRIRPKVGWKPRPPEPLSQLADEQLIARLGHGNGWQRDTAQRLLVERRDPAMTEPLMDVLRSGSPLAAAHALAVLDALAPLARSQLEIVATRRDPRLSRVALRLLRSRLPTEPELLTCVEPLIRGADDALEFAWVHALTALDTPQAIELLAKPLAKKPSDWTALAVSCASPATALALLQRLDALPLAESGKGPSLELQRALSSQAARAGDEALAWCLQQAVDEVEQKGHLDDSALTLLAGLADGLALEGKRLAPVLGAQSSPIAHLAANRALDATAAPERRRLALEIVQTLGESAAARKLLPLLVATVEPAIAAPAARAIVELCNLPLAEEVFAAWESYSISTRQALLRSSGASSPFTSALVKALEAGTVTPGELDPDQRTRLASLPDPTIAARVQQVFAATIDASREEVLARYAAVLTMPGDPAHGGALFRQHCATCHTLLGTGTRVGPELSSVASRPAEQILTDLLDPSRQLSPDFMNYTVVTTDGRAYAGLLAADTPASVILRRGEGLEDTIPRADIELFQATGKSLMPEGLEQRLTAQDVADLLALLQAPRIEHLKP